MQFEGPPEQFLAHLLSVQCHLASAEGGAIMRLKAADQCQIVASSPPVDPAQPSPMWLAKAAEMVPQVIRDGRTHLIPVHGGDDLYGQNTDEHLVLLPLRRGGAVRGVAGYRLRRRNGHELQHSRERLELTVSLLSLYEMRLTLAQRTAALTRLREAEEILAAVNEQSRARAAAMALCNELASRFGAERVALGFLHGRYVKLEAISHTEKFTRKMKLVQAIESAMEECLDQDLEIVHPAPNDAPYVSRAAAELATEQGQAAICCLPLRQAGEPRAVLIIEKPADQPFTVEQVEMLRLVADLCSARVIELHERDRWIGARLAASTRRAGAKLVGPEHTWLKLGAVAVLIALAAVTFLRGTDYIEAPFIIEASRQQVIPAPFDGFIEAIHVEPGDAVLAGQTVLAELDASDLRLQLAQAQATLAAHLKQAAIAMRDGKTVEVQIAQAQAEQVRAEINLVEHRIAKSTLISPIDGVVIAGDLKRQIGAPVATGDVMFEVAPLQAIRAEVMVPEDRVNDLLDEQDQQGRLATAAFPGRYLDFTVERVNPVAEVVEQRNVFRVRARLTEVPQGLAPGMEGVAKINVGRRSYLYLWTRDLANWIRMKLWI